MTKESKHVVKFKERHAKEEKTVMAWGDGYIGEMMGKGDKTQYNGALIVTEERVVFYRKGLFGEKIESIPYFTTIAVFVSSHSQQMTALFHKVLMVCCKSGLVGKEHFAIDGCKLPSDASKPWSGTHKDLKKKSDKLRRSAENIIQQHLSNDNTKDASVSARALQTVDTLLKNAEKLTNFWEKREKEEATENERLKYNAMLQIMTVPR